ncbi:MAG: S8 family peptidase [bacterium]
MKYGFISLFLILSGYVFGADNSIIVKPISKNISKSSAIEVIPESLVFRIDSSSYKCESKTITKKEIELPNMDTLWAKEDYWKDITPGKVIITYNSSVDVHNATYKELGILDKSITIVDKGLSPLNFIVVDVPGNLDNVKSFMQIMKNNPCVKFVEPERPMHILATPNDTYYGGYQWDKRLLNCPAAWDLGYGSMDISIAVIDQGSDYNHQDLSAHYKTDTLGYDFLDNDNNPVPLDTLEAHGTHCSGVAAAVIGNGKGIAGISNSRLYSLRAGSSTTLPSASCANSIQWCADRKVRVISMSWGNYTLVSQISQACLNAWNAGCLLVSATGNDGTTPMMYPARLSQVIAVGAIDSTSARWQYSNYGSETELIAPGVGVIGTIPLRGENSYQLFAGTSEACPQVAGIAALVLSASPTLTNQEVRDILDSTATDLGTAGRDQYHGYGKPNAYAAVQKALSISGPRDTAVLTVNNKDSAADNLIVSGITKSANWIISISLTSFGVAPGGTRQVTVVAGGALSSGTYKDTLWIHSNDPINPYPVPVTLLVGIGVEENNVISPLSLKAFFNAKNKQIDINYSIVLPSNVKLTLLDAAGRVVKNILESRKAPGSYNMAISANGLKTGVYFVVLKMDNKQLSQKVILIK